MFFLISRTVTEDIKKKLHSLLNAGIDAYVIVDKDLERASKRFIGYDNQELDDAGYNKTNVTHRSREEIYRVTGWDKVLYHAYLSKEKYVWICEDDVFWNRPGAIKMILDAAQNVKSDLICTPLAESYQSKPNWYHWPKAEVITNKKQFWMGTFNQLCRVSDKLLTKVNKFAKEHKGLVLHEPMLGTLAKMNGLKVSYISDLKLPMYIDIRWFPQFTEGEIEDIVKENSYVVLHPFKSPEANKLFAQEHAKARANT